ncbi:FGGY family carbohydrate kinase [Leifsonia kafniensis]|uniref:ATP:glycerol 3-phosphotransferase n=1 Tax=Leifsonia kafniensis TaxID=475957 RepID=A0ABP7KY22_9MICO
MTVLAIDQGTSGTKAIVHDGESILAVVEVPVRPHYRSGGLVEIDAHTLLDSVLESGRRAVAEAGNPPIDMVSLANQGESVLAWDQESGQPLSQTIIWQDKRAQPICDELFESSAAISATTGLVLDPYFSAPKMTWLRRNQTKDGVVTTTDSWLVHQLTGEFVTDATTASRSLVFGLDSGEWDADMLRLFRLDDEALPRIVRNDEVVGTTSAFGGSIPVGGLIVDQQAALLAQNCLSAGDLKCTFGTGAFLLGNVGQAPLRSAHGLSTSVAWSFADGQSYCLDGQSLTMGSAVRWMVAAGLLSAPDALDAECGESTNGAVFVPGLAGFAAPRWETDARGAFVGLSLETEKHHLIRAVVEGLAAQVTELVHCLERDAGTPIRRLNVDGGATRSRALMQAQADLLQIPIDCFPSAHATVLGTAAAARLSLDPGRALGEVVTSWTPSMSYEPRWQPDRADEVRSAWDQAVLATTSLGRKR